MQFYKQKLFLLLFLILHTQALHPAPTPLEISLMLLKTKLLSLSQILSPLKLTYPTIEKEEHFYKPDFAYFMSIFDEIMARNILSEEEKTIPAAKLLSCFLAGETEQDRILYLLSKYDKEKLKKILTPGHKIDGSKVTTPQGNVYDFKKLDENEIRDLIAKKWVRNAAVSIFEDPLRSFLELVVNAIDTTLEANNMPEKVVGKFGMGFFSILAFLWFQDENWGDDYGTTIDITTANKESPEKQLTAWHLTFSRKPDALRPGDPNHDDINIRFDSTKKKNIQEKTGTIISITPKNKKYTFSQKTLDTIKSWIHSLDTYKTVPIRLSINNGNPIKIGLATNELPIVIIKLQNDCLMITDEGTGMSLETILYKLLVPSVSTKRKDTLAEDREKALNNNNPELPYLLDTQNSREKSYFIITVNDIIVVKKELKNPFRDSQGFLKNIVIPMPHATQLTIARNELAIGESKDNFEKKYITFLIDKTIDNICTQQGATQSSLLLALYNGLKDWEFQTAAQHIKNFFSNHLKKTLKNALDKHPEYIPIPKLFAQRMNTKKENLTIFADTDQNIYIPLDEELANYNFSAFEKNLKNLYTKKHKNESIEFKKKIIEDGLSCNLISGYHVYFVPDSLLPEEKTANGNTYNFISTLGTRTSLFIPESLLLLNDRKKITDEITSSYTDEQIKSINEDKQEPKSFILSTNDLHGISNVNIRSKTSIEDANNRIKSFQHDIETDQEEILKKKASNESFTKNDKHIIDCKNGIKDHEQFIKSSFVIEDFIKTGKYTSPIKLTENQKNLILFMGKNINYSLLSHFLFFDNKGILSTPIKNILETEKDLYIFIINNNDKGLLLKINPNFNSLSYKELKSYVDPQSEEYLSCYTSEQDIISHKEHLKIYIDNNFLDIKSPLYEKLKEKFCIKQVYELTSSDVVHMLLFILYKKFNIIVENKFNTDIYYYANERKVWPFTNDKNKNESNAIKEFEALFSSLLYYSNNMDKKNAPFYSFISLALVKNSFGDLFGDKGRDLLFLNTFGKHTPIFINTAEIDEKNVISFINFIKNDYLWFSSITKSLHDIVEFFSTKTYMNDVAILLKTVFEKDDNNTIKNGIYSLKESILSLYKKYFSIDSSMYPSSYGNKPTKIRIFECNSDIEEKNICATLFDLFEQAHNKKLFNKLLDFQIRDFIQKTNKEIQHDELSQKELYGPRMLAHTPISLLGSLYQKISEKNRANIIFTILEKSNSIEELIFICYIFLQKNILSLVCNSTSNITPIIERIIETYIQEKMPTESIQEIYRENRKIEDLDDRIEKVNQFHKHVITNIEQMLTTFISQKDDYTKETNFFQKELNNFSLLNTMKNLEWFSANQNLIANMRGEGLKKILNNNELNDAIKKIKQIKSTQSVLGKIQQCVEAGSEKRPSEATVIELLQNTIDAVRNCVNEYKNDPPQKRNNYSLQDFANILFTLESQKSKLGQDKSHTVFTIHDQAGFPNLSTLLIDFLLPDFSNKSPEKGNIGDMGNGSFKMYQDAYLVSLLTRLSDTKTNENNINKFYLLIIKPIRNPKTDLVTDLKFSCNDVSDFMLKSNPNFWGTSIKITFNATDTLTTHINLFALKDFLENCIGTVSASINPQDHISKQIPFNCLYNNTAINYILTPNDIIFEYTLSDLKRDLNNEKEFNDFKASCKIKSMELKDNHVLFKITKRKKEFLQSYMTTSGIPFRPLCSIAKEMSLLPDNFISRMSHGFIVDLDRSTYSPVQSRAHLKMFDSLKKGLRVALFETFYRIGLIKAEEELKNPTPNTPYIFLSNHFTHIKSTCSDFYQLMLGANEKSLFKSQMQSWYEGKPNNTIVSESLFFDYYTSRNHNKSFYDYLNTDIRNLFLNIDEKIKNNKKSNITIFKEWERENNNSIKEFKEHGENLALLKKDQETNQEKIKELTNQIEKEKQKLLESKNNTYTSKIEPLLKNFKKEKDEFFEEWKIKLSGNLKNIVLAWTEPKYINKNFIDYEWSSIDYLKNEKELNTLEENKKNYESDMNVIIDNLKNKSMDSPPDATDTLLFLGTSIKELFITFCKHIGKCEVNIIFYHDLQEYSQEKTAGFFYDPTNTIYLNLVYFNITSIIKFILSIVTYKTPPPLPVLTENVVQVTKDISSTPITTLETLRNAYAFQEYFMYKSGNATILNHELEHARLKDTKQPNTHGFHDNHIDAYGNKYIPFEACANSFIKKAIQEKALNSWINDFYKKIQKEDLKGNKQTILLDRIQIIQNSLRQVETTCPKDFFLKIGLIDEKVKIPQ